MKKFIPITFFLIMFVNTAFAEVMQKGNDGLSYWNGDINYLIIDWGTAYLTVVDLCSTNILHDDKNGFEFTVREFLVNGNKNQIEMENITNFFEHYQSKKIYKDYIEWPEKGYLWSTKISIFNKMKMTALKNK